MPSKNFLVPCGKLAPPYNEWETTIHSKHAFTFHDFVEKLEVFYTSMEESSKDGVHFLRTETRLYRERFDLEKGTLFRKGIDKPYHNYFADIEQQIIDQNSAYVASQDSIQIDHVLSCQVFDAILRACSDKYSFDRYFSFQSWINKCWNFIMLPSKVNNKKGKFEVKIIGLLDKHLKNGEFVHKAEIDPSDWKMMSDYFQCVADFLKNYCKEDFLDQAKNIKKMLVGFLQQFDSNFVLEDIQNALYPCDAKCFCNKKNISGRRRRLVYHVFCKINFKSDFSTWNEDLEKKFTKLLENPAKPKTQKRREMRKAKFM